MTTEYQPQLFVTEKTCNLCGDTKPLADFYRNKKSPDGRLAQCKACVAPKNRAAYYADRERVLAQKKAEYDADREGNLARQQQWRDDNREWVRERARLYRQNNYEIVLEQERRRYRENRERELANQRARRERDPEKFKQYARDSYERHREQAKAKQRDYYWRNVEQIREKKRQWRIDNPEKTYELNRARRWRRRMREIGSEYREIDFELIWQRDSGICHICEQAVPYDDKHFDHVVPLSRGGEHKTENIKVAHSRCNLLKGVKLLSEM